MAQLAFAIVSGGAQAVAAYKKSKYHTRQAAEYREAKNRRMAATTREMREEERKAEFIKSRAVAVAAASGAGTDAGFVKLLSDLSAEGKYRTLSVLWQGQNDAEGLIQQARNQERASKDALTMGAIKAVTSAFSAYQSAGGSFGSTTPAPVQSTYNATISEAGGLDVPGFGDIAQGRGLA
jgi:hypothetical protein